MQPEKFIKRRKHELLHMLTGFDWELDYKNNQSMITAIEARALILRAADKLKKIEELENVELSRNSKRS